MHVLNTEVSVLWRSNIICRVSVLDQFPVNGELARVPQRERVWLHSIPGICTSLLWATAVIVEVLLGFEVRVHSTIEGGGGSCLWCATNCCRGFKTCIIPSQEIENIYSVTSVQ